MSSKRTETPEVRGLQYYFKVCCRESGNISRSAQHLECVQQHSTLPAPGITDHSELQIQLPPNVPGRRPTVAQRPGFQTPTAQTHTEILPWLLAGLLLPIQASGNFRHFFLFIQINKSSEILNILSNKIFS